MGSVTPPYVNFTGGEIGEALMNRVDQQTYPFTGALYKNCWPMAQGPLTRSPGTQYVDTVSGAAKGDSFSFEYSDTETYLIDATDLKFKIYLDDALLSTPAVSTTMSALFTDTSELPAYISVSSGEITLDSDGSVEARAQQSVTVSAGDQADRHVLVFDVENGPVDLYVGTTSGGNELVSHTDLRTGKHYISFTPGASPIYVQFAHQGTGIKVVDNIQFSAGGTLEIVTPYLVDDLRYLQIKQTGDTLYIAHEDYHPRRLERRGHYSWSIVLFQPKNGPFVSANLTNTTLTPSDTTGQVNLAASKDLFTSDDVGAVFELTQTGQSAKTVAASADIATPGVKVVGAIAADRTVDFAVTGVFVATVTLQKSYNNSTDWQDVSTYAVPTSGTVTDNATNTTVYYRMIVGSGDYTSGSVQMELTCDHGSQTGHCRVLEITNTTTAVAEVLSQLASSTQATRIWRRSVWTPDNGYPAAVAFGYGRLWWGGGFRIFASASDDFDNYKDDAELDDAAFTYPISDTPGGIRWMSFLKHLAVGTRDREFIGVPPNSSQPVSASNFQMLPQTHNGSSLHAPVDSDTSIIFIQKNGRRLLQFLQDPKALSDSVYTTVDLNRLHPEITRAGVRDMAIQYEPERRIWVLLNNGEIRTLLFRREEDIVAWSRYTLAYTGHSAHVESITSIRNTSQDDIYLRVARRDSGGTTYRTIEKVLPDPSLVKIPQERYHVSCAAVSAPTKPEATITSISGMSGSVTVKSDVDAFEVADVGKIMWINGGRGEVTARASATQVTVNFNYALDSTDAAGPGEWCMATTVSTVSGLSRFNSQNVYGWVDGKEVGPIAVSGGSATLPFSGSIYALGAPIEMRWKSSKMSWGGDKGTALAKIKQAHELGIIVMDSTEHAEIGGHFDRTMPMRFRYDSGEMWDEGMPLFTGEVLDTFSSDGTQSDPRICIKTNAAGPFTLSGLVPHVETHDYA